MTSSESRPEAIGRLQHSDGVPYYLMSRNTAQTLIQEPQALALLTYLLSLPSDWEINTHHLAKQTGSSDRTVRRWLTTLREAGYVRPRQIRRKDGTVHRHIVEVRPDPSVPWPGETEPGGHICPGGLSTDVTDSGSQTAIFGRVQVAKTSTPGPNVRHTENILSSTENTAADICEETEQPHVTGFNAEIMANLRNAVRGEGLSDE